MAFGNLTELIPMSALAAMLIVIGFEVMPREGKDLAATWRIDKVSASLAFLVVILAVFEDLTVAIFAGVILSMLLYVMHTANRFKVIELAPAGDDIRDQPASPDALEGNQEVVIDITGIVGFTSVYSFDEYMPDPKSATNAAVVSRMRGREFHSLTVLDWLEKYADEMREAGNLYLISGVEQEFLDTLERANLVEAIGPENIFPETKRLGESTQQALAAAQAWIDRPKSG